MEGDKCFTFLQEYDTAAEAQAAIDGMNGELFDGEPLKVEFSRNRGPRKPRKLCFTVCSADAEDHGSLQDEILAIGEDSVVVIVAVTAVAMAAATVAAIVVATVVTVVATVVTVVATVAATVVAIVVAVTVAAIVVAVTVVATVVTAAATVVAATVVATAAVTVVAIVVAVIVLVGMTVAVVMHTAEVAAMGRPQHLQQTSNCLPAAVSLFSVN